MDEITTAIISSIFGAISGGIVNWILEKRKERREDKKEKEKENKKVYENRPGLDIVEYKDYIERPGYGIKKECDINIFLAKIANVVIDEDIVKAEFYDEHFNQEEWCCVIYTFRNMGKTDIQCINPVCNSKKDTILYDASQVKEFSAYGLINYSVWFEKKLRVGETFTMKVCFHKSCVITGMFSALMSMVLQDDNGRYWSQPIFVPNEKIYNSNRISHKEYRERILANSAIECFRKPWLW